MSLAIALYIYVEIFGQPESASNLHWGKQMALSTRKLHGTSMGNVNLCDCPETQWRARLIVAASTRNCWLCDLTIAYVMATTLSEG